MANEFQNFQFFFQNSRWLIEEKLKALIDDLFHLSELEIKLKIQKVPRKTENRKDHTLFLGDYRKIEVKVFLES